MTRIVDQVALEPLREALLARARGDAMATTAAAMAQAQRLVCDAESSAAQRLSEARARGRAEAALAAADEAARIRQEARSLLLTAHRDVQEELRRRAREAVRQLRDDGVYSRLRRAVENQGRLDFGSSATSREADGGGWYVEAPGRCIDARLDTLADWAIDVVQADDLVLTETGRPP